MQKAGFSIAEIRGLLNKDDAEIYYAFETKIAEEEKRLQEIKNIQKTYQTEITNMKNKIETLHKSINSMHSTKKNDILYIQNIINPNFVYVET